MLTAFSVFGLTLGNEIPVYLLPLMGAAVLSVAYVRPHSARKILRGNDFSYGLYIYHLPIVNVLLHGGRSGGVHWVAVALALAMGCAVASWFMVERPFLRLKNAALRPVGA